MVGNKKRRVVDDERFAHIATDPKFRTLKQSIRRVKADSRWRAMVKDERFTLKASAVDKRGRPKHTSLKEDLLRVYDISESESDTSSLAESDDDEQTTAIDADSASTKKNVQKSQLVRPSPDELLPDIARGEGLVESSLEDDDDDDDGDGGIFDNEVDHAWGELDKDAGQTSNATSRFAVCNVDWDRMRAVDLLVLFNSFKPERGIIHSVSIYPSEYGLQKMNEEKESGPTELRDLPLNQDEDDAVTCDDGKDYHREKLRQYQLNRLRYYYAVVTCDSPETANEIYDKCDGIEYECSANKLDLRFIPDDMTFEHEPKSTATSLPDGATYEPSVFVNSALQCSSVTLTWDETPHERKIFMERNFSKDDLEEQDLKDYIASDTDSGEDPYGDLIDDSEWRQRPGELETAEDESDDVDKIEKFKELVRSLKDEKEHRDEKHIEMEVTWEPGLKERTEKKIKKQEQSNKKLSPWEEYKEKKKKKRLEKKEAHQTKRTQPEDYSDDDLPPDVDLADPYFAEELAQHTQKDNVKKRKKDKKKKIKLSPVDEDNLKRQQAELALLVMDSGVDGKKHFDLSERKKKKKSAKLRKLDKGKNNMEKNEVIMDVRDPRFKAIYENPLYNVDPSAPEFKRSKTMEAILEEKVKRRTKSNL